MPITINGTGPVDGITSINTSVSSTELGFLDGVTSAIQTQINSKPTGGTGAWISYTPTLTASVTNPTLGTGSSQIGKYVQMGKTVFVRGIIAFGSSGVNAGSGNYFINLPIQGLSDGTNIYGLAWFYRASTNSGNAAIAADLQPGLLTVPMYSLSSSIAITNANPWVWAAGDQIRFNLVYEAL